MAGLGHIVRGGTRRPGNRSLPASALARRDAQWPLFAPKAGPRARLLYVNDLSRDVDGLFATVHALLSPSIELRAIVGTATGVPKEGTASSVALAQEMVRLCGREGNIPVHEAGAGS